MYQKSLPAADYSARWSFWLLFIFMVMLWCAGGSSRADVSGQAIVRFFACFFLATFAIYAPRLNLRPVRSLAILLGVSIVLVIAQLIRLPPNTWLALPGHDLFAKAAEASGEPQPWRPLSISPSDTKNALASLVVPATTLVLASGLTEKQHRQLLTVLIGLILAGCLLALLQFTGASFQNPFINYVQGAVSGNFANRNHFALFLAIGCLLVPVWGFERQRFKRWKAVSAMGLLPLFLLILLATGSRAGLLLGAIGISLGLFIVRDVIRSQLQSVPKAVSLALAGGVAIAISAAVIVSIYLGRAVAINRAFDMQATADLRVRALPYVIQGIGRYFPFGEGFGTFDPGYRIIEPDTLLQPAYFNHAHNDWLEVILDGGLAGALVLLSGVVWWLVASFKAWRSEQTSARLARAASGAILLILLASVVDYPARTPMIMAVLVIAAIWLVPKRTSIEQAGKGALRRRNADL